MQAAGWNSFAVISLLSRFNASENWSKWVGLSAIMTLFCGNGWMFLYPVRSLKRGRFPAFVTGRVLCIIQILDSGNIAEWENFEGEHFEWNSTSLAKVTSHKLTSFIARSTSSLFARPSKVTLMFPTNNLHFLLSLHLTRFSALVLKFACFTKKNITSWTYLGLVVMR